MFKQDLIVIICWIQQVRTNDAKLTLSIPLHATFLKVSTNLHDVRKFFTRYVDCAVVHELDDGLQVVEVDILQNDDRVLTRIDAEQGLEIIRTCWQKHFVRLKVFTLGCQGHIY